MKAQEKQPSKTEQATLLNDLARFITSSDKVIVYLRNSFPCCNVESGEIILSRSENYATNKAISLHECFHFLFSKKIPDSFINNFSYTERPKIAELINALEDLRSENFGCKVIVLARHYLDIVEIQTTQKISEKNNGNIKINEQIKALYFLIMTAKPHLSGLIKLTIDERIKERVKTALNYYSDNEQDLLNGTFENLLNHSLKIWDIIKNTPKEQKAQEQAEQERQERQQRQQQRQQEQDLSDSERQQQEQQQENEQHSGDEQKENQEQQDSEQEGKEQDKAGISNEKDGKEKGKGKQTAKQKAEQEKAQAQADAQAEQEQQEQESENAQAQDFYTDISKGTIKAEDFRTEKEFKEKKINNQKVRDLENSDLIKKTNALNILKKFCKAEIIDINDSNKIERFY